MAVAEVSLGWIALGKMAFRSASTMFLLTLDFSRGPLAVFS